MLWLIFIRKNGNLLESLDEPNENIEGKPRFASGHKLKTDYFPIKLIAASNKMANCDKHLECVHFKYKAFYFATAIQHEI